ncbi:hypothetical protein C8F01DRAFT_1226566 [Mycena amicta]|nr:hypothetical protein C8F01DRAFT_1226566 [Mycena amicta]
MYSLAQSYAAFIETQYKPFRTGTFESAASCTDCGKIVELEDLIVDLVYSFDLRFSEPSGLITPSPHFLSTPHCTKALHRKWEDQRRPRYPSPSHLRPTAETQTDSTSSSASGGDAPTGSHPAASVAGSLFSVPASRQHNVAADGPPDLSATLSSDLPSLTSNVDFGASPPAQDGEEGGWTPVSRRNSRSHRVGSVSPPRSPDTCRSAVDRDNDTASPKSPVARATQQLRTLGRRYDVLADRAENNGGDEHVNESVSQTAGNSVVSIENEIAEDDVHVPAEKKYHP